MQRDGSRRFPVHCLQRGQCRMVLSKDAVTACRRCGRERKAVIRGDRIMIFELPGEGNSDSGRTRAHSAKLHSRVLTQWGIEDV